MILSSLVADDPGGFIELDKNLARHVGEDNVEAFHEEAGNLVVDEMIQNSEIVNELFSDEMVVAELGAAVNGIQAKAFGLSAQEGRENNKTLVKTLMQVSGSKDVGFLRDVIQGELLTNGLINDRTMRNPAIMKLLNERVQELFEKYEKEAKAKK